MAAAGRFDNNALNCNITDAIEVGKVVFGTVDSWSLVNLNCRQRDQIKFSNYMNCAETPELEQPLT
ncbi:MAG: hypothetical protein DMF69_11820 [Acidobacteria bacterium]|nr:MAG: hypothetical protein DMF69_11820 [Acidobacteriota bacterium]